MSDKGYIQNVQGRGPSRTGVGSTGAHPLVIIYKYIVFYQCKYVRNNASWYKCQLVSDANFLNRCIASLTFFDDAPSESGNRLILLARNGPDQPYEIIEYLFNKYSTYRIYT